MTLFHIRYYDSKSNCANILFTRELSKKLEGTRVTVNCLHPGFVRTNFDQSGENPKRSVVMDVARSLLSVSPEKGAETSIYLATSKDVPNITGKYFVNKKLAKPSRLATDDALALRLWQKSERSSV